MEGHKMSDLREKVKMNLSISSKVFLITAVSIMTPIYLMFMYLNSSFSSYLDKEISNKVSQTIANSEDKIYSKQETLINVSNIFSSNETFKTYMADNKLSYYEKSRYFDRFVSQMINNNLFDVEDMEITYFDGQKRIYTNWNVNYNDYTFLLDQDWIKKGNIQKGYFAWDLFGQSPFLGDEGNRYISLARSCGASQEGTLILSLSVKKLNKILEEYKYSDRDYIYICSTKEKEALGYPLPERLKSDIDAIYPKMTGDTGSFIDIANNNKYIVTYYSLSNSSYFADNDFKTVALIDYQNVAEKTQEYLLKTTLLFIAFSLFLFLIVYFISNKAVQPIKVISGKLSTYRVKDEFQYEYKSKDEIGELYQAFSDMTNNINELFDSLDHEYKIKEKYRFESLRAQINPHFIFNTLNNLRWMAIIRKQDNITEGIDALTDMLQYSMNKGSDIVTLKQELDSIDSYIYIQNMRYGEGCQYKVKIPELLYQCEMIKFSLQPIVENCFIHGFKDMGGKAIITIEGYVRGDQLILEIGNNGVLVSDQVIENFENSKNAGHRDSMQVTGIGMTNVDEIIKITYGSAYGIHLMRKNDMTIVQYALPYIIHNNN